MSNVRSPPYATRKIVDEPAFPLLKPPTGQSGAERQHWNLAGFPAPVIKDAEGNEVPPDEDAPPPELVRRSSRLPSSVCLLHSRQPHSLFSC